MATVIGARSVRIRGGFDPGTSLRPCVRSEGHGASDAHASDTDARIGGWWSLESTPIKSSCRWFSVELTKENAACAYETTPQRVISTLEMLGSRLLLELAANSSGPGLRNMAVCGIMDSQCNSFALLRNYSRTAPAAYAHMELALAAELFGRLPNVVAQEARGQHLGRRPQQQHHGRLGPRIALGRQHIVDAGVLQRRRRDLPFAAFFLRVLLLRRARLTGYRGSPPVFAPS